MNSFFDIRTLSFCSGLVSACLFVCMAYVHWNRKTYPGFGQWTLAFLLNFIGFFLLSLRNILPVFVTVILANTLIVLCYAFIVRGLKDFADIEQNSWLDLPLLIVIVLCFFYFSYVWPSVNARIVTVSMAIVFLCLRCVYITVRKIPGMLAEKNALLAITFVSVVLWFFSRAVLTILSNEIIEDFMTAGATHGLSIITVSIGNIFIAVGLIIINDFTLYHDPNLPAGLNCKGLVDPMKRCGNLL